MDVSTCAKPLSFQHRDRGDEIRQFAICDPELEPIYSSHAVTEGYLSDPEWGRTDIYALFGPRSNLLCFLFCKCKKYSIGKTVMLPYPLLHLADDNWHTCDRCWQKLGKWSARVHASPNHYLMCRMCKDRLCMDCAFAAVERPRDRLGYIRSM